MSLRGGTGASCGLWQTRRCNVGPAMPSGSDAFDHRRLLTDYFLVQEDVGAKSRFVGLRHYLVQVRCVFRSAVSSFRTAIIPLSHLNLHRLTFDSLNRLRYCRSRKETLGHRRPNGIGSHQRRLRTQHWYECHVNCSLLRAHHPI